MTTAFDAMTTISRISRFLVDKLAESGQSGYVIGLSGGIDSALSATLATRAVGKEKVHGILMPYRSSSPASVEDALELAEKLQIETRKVDISPMIDAYFAEITPELKLRAGNKMARERMSVLFDVAHETQRLVLGTGNRTEICLGYTTWYGDAACSVNPIGHLYKTEVRQLAAELGIPESIQGKAPSADLWAGQTDEDEIGVRYEEIDRLLEQLVDNNLHSLSRLEQAGFNRSDIERVVELLNKNNFKRRLPDIAGLDRGDIPDHIHLKE